MAASVGVSPSTWRNYEKDETFPSPTTIGALIGIYHVNKEWLDTNEGEMYVDGYRAGDPLGEPISLKEMMLRELKGTIFEKVTESGGEPAEDRLNQIIEDLQEIQDRVAELSDELDEGDLEDAEGDLDIVIDKIGDVIEKHGWKVR